MVIKLVAATRYLVIFPIIGLAITSAALFVLAGVGLLGFLIEAIVEGSSGHGVEVLPIIELVEFVHQFLIGTVLYITAVGLYPLFIQEIQFPNWLKIDSTEELETNLIGVTVVVLAVNFLGVVFAREQRDLLNYGAGIALPIAALALFVGVRIRAASALRREEAIAAAEGDVSVWHPKPGRATGTAGPDGKGAVADPEESSGRSQQTPPIVS
jgi:uncharacterized membrane protein YqhA